MNVLIVSTSLNSKSRSRRLAIECGVSLRELGCTVDLADLRESPLPLCDGETIWDDPRVISLRAKVSAADAILICGPIYNWCVGASTKNFVECVGHALDGKLIGIACAAGGPRALLAPGSLATGLMADFHATIIPKILVIDEVEIPDGRLPEQTERRIRELAENTVYMSVAARHAAQELHRSVQVA